ncbi:hypothetical protein DVT68_00105 [Dyella solisilvae]|uniref:Uncharacterized protein n=1 Tax=Dyella solisilvae TaxID=1920168 RepID=A0A370K9H3_9GAMM|nr:hypothetical protein [Dyella solisilvae]RDI99306.1 hypothetical protein DVT68_00105 [Dyella solisilvae]
MRKLVELDQVTMVTKEFDEAKIERSALALKEYLLGLTPKEDALKMKELVLPIVEQALSRTLELPFDNRKKPFRYESGEGLLPAEYSKLASPFFVAISGMSGLGSNLIDPIHKDGKIYVWMEFEDAASRI